MTNIDKKVSILEEIAENMDVEITDKFMKNSDNVLKVLYHLYRKEETEDVKELIEMFTKRWLCLELLNLVENHKDSGRL